MDSKAIAGAHGGLLVDLDGTVYRWSTAITGAADALEKIGRRAVFLTNNASRSRDEVAAHMRTMGLTIDRGNVVTSARTAARLLGAGRLVKITGGRRLIATDLHARGFGDRADDLAAAIHQTKTEVFRARIVAGEVSARPGLVDLMHSLVDDEIRIAVATTGRAAWVNPLLRTLLDTASSRRLSPATTSAD